MIVAKGRLKLGCLGCSGVVLLLAAVAVVVMLVAVATARPVQVQDRVIVHELPEAAPGQSQTPGRVHLSVRETEILVSAVAAGEPIRIEARFDSGAYELIESFRPSGADTPGWVVDLSLDRNDDPGAFPGLVSVARGSIARVTVFLPAGVPLDFEFRARNCHATIRLAGLWLERTHLETVSGALDLNVREPLREPMETLTVRSSRSGLLLNNLGNASPRLLQLDYSLGGVDVDLGGQWRRDANIRINGRFGGGVIHLPAHATLEGLAARGFPALSPETESVPTLDFEISTKFGRLELSDLRLARGTGRSTPSE